MSFQASHDGHLAAHILAVVGVAHHILADTHLAQAQKEGES